MLDGIIYMHLKGQNCENHVNQKSFFDTINVYKATCRGEAIMILFNKRKTMYDFYNNIKYSYIGI